MRLPQRLRQGCLHQIYVGCLASSPSTPVWCTIPFVSPHFQSFQRLNIISGLVAVLRYHGFAVANIDFGGYDIEIRASPDKFWTSTAFRALVSFAFGLV